MYHSLKKTFWCFRARWEAVWQRRKMFAFLSTVGMLAGCYLVRVLQSCVCVPQLCSIIRLIKIFRFFLDISFWFSSCLTYVIFFFLFGDNIHMGVSVDFSSIYYIYLQQIKIYYYLLNIFYNGTFSYSHMLVSFFYLIIFFPEKIHLISSNW